MSKAGNLWKRFLAWLAGLTKPTPDPVVPGPTGFLTFNKGRIVRLEKVTHNYSALFHTPVGLRACAYENLHELGRDDSYILDPLAGDHGRRIYSEKCETFGEPVGSNALRIPQEGDDQRINVYDPVTGVVTQGPKQTYKIALCGVVLREIPHVFSWNQKGGGDSKTVMQNALTGDVVYTFPKGIVGCPVSAVELTPGVALCAFQFGKDAETICVTTDGRRVEGDARINALSKAFGGRTFGGDKAGVVFELVAIGSRLTWAQFSKLGGKVFKLRADGERYLYATVDGPPRLCVILPDGRWKELDRGTQQYYGQFGLNVAVGPGRVWWTRQDESKTGCVVELTALAALGEDD